MRAESGAKATAVQTLREFRSVHIFEAKPKLETPHVVSYIQDMVFPLDNNHWGNYGCTMQTLNAHFDGRFVVLDEPAQLKTNAKVTVLAPDADHDGLADGCIRLSEPAFQKIWDNPLDADYDRL